MAFSIEVPSEEDINKYNLPYQSDLKFPLEHRRSWLADRDRGIYITGPGATGNPAFEDNVKSVFNMYIESSKFKIILEPRLGPCDFSVRPYNIHWPAVLEILTYHSDGRGMIDALKATKATPNTPVEILHNRSINEILGILKEALSILKAGDYNKYIQAPITVSFGF